MAPEPRKCRLESCKKEFIPKRRWQDFCIPQHCQEWHNQERRRATALLQKEREERERKS